MKSTSGPSRLETLSVCVFLAIPIVVFFWIPTNLRFQTAISQAFSSVVSPEMAFIPSQPPARGGCPTLEDTQDSISSLEILIAEAQDITAGKRDTHNTSTPQASMKETVAWRERMDGWTVQNDVLITNCALLLSAHGTPVFPEIPLALENLKLSGEWLVKSVDAAAQGKTKATDAYIRGARAAAERANGLIDGRLEANPRTALIEVPGYIKAIEEP